MLDIEEILKMHILPYVERNMPDNSFSMTTIPNVSKVVKGWLSVNKDHWTPLGRDEMSNKKIQKF